MSNARKIRASHSRHKNATHIFFLPFFVDISRRNAIIPNRSCSSTKLPTDLVVGFNKQDDNQYGKRDEKGKLQQAFMRVKGKKRQSLLGD